MSIIYSFAVKKSYSDSIKVNFRVLKIGFRGDTFVAREHNTNSMFFIFTKILYTTNVGLQTDFVVNVIKRTCITKPV